MKVAVNGQPCDIPAGVASFGDLVFFVEQQRLPEGEVLTTISLDGEELDEDQERDCASRACSELSSVEFWSAKPLDLIREGLEDACELLPGLSDDIPDVAAALRSGKVAEGLEMFSPCIEVVGWYTSLLSAVDTFLARGDGSTGESSADAEELATELGGLREDGVTNLRSFASIENLRQKLVDIEQAQNQNDHLLLADLLEYELLPILAIWSEESPLLLRRMTREDALA